MRKFIAAMSVAGLSAFGLQAVEVEPAGATAGCVKRNEFSKVKRGMRINRVHAIFDTDGKKLAQAYGMLTREYKPCSDPQYGFVWVDYERRNSTWKVSGKAAYWG